MPALRNVVCIPALELQLHPAFRAMLSYGMSPEWLEYHIIRVMMSVARDVPTGDLTTVSPRMIAAWAGADEAFGVAFREHFLTDGQFVLYQELNGSRIRHREKCRLRMRAARTGEKAPPKRSRKQTQNAVPTPSLFSEAWAKYPKRSGGNPKALAEKAWIARVKAGVPEQELLDATVGYAKVVRREGRENTVYVMQGSTLYGANERWKDFLNVNLQEKSDLDDVLSEVARAYESSDS
jgi:hypothetical protein